jgi:sulfur relay protein TusB/DsrH
MTRTLHTVHAVTALSACLDRAGRDADLLLLEEAVYAALADHELAAQLGRRRAFVLAADLALRGLASRRLAPGLRPIGMAEFVALTIEHNPCVAWF